MCFEHADNLLTLNWQQSIKALGTKAYELLSSSEMVIRAHVQEEQDLDSLPWQHMGSPVQPSISLGCVTLLSKYRINWEISLLIFHCCYYPKITQNKLQTTVREKTNGNVIIPVGRALSKRKRSWVLFLVFRMLHFIKRLYSTRGTKFWQI